jgi:nucleotide-binding universal stress UspA family protein
MFDRILLALDGSDESRKAAAVAADLAAQGGSEVVVLHARDMYGSGAAASSPEWTDKLESSLQEAVDAFRSRGLNARLDIRDTPRGHAGKAIAEAAADLGCGLIVLGRRGRSHLPPFLMGSVSTRVLHLAAPGPRRPLSATARLPPAGRYSFLMQPTLAILGA